jgi:hypothetical protein
VVPVSSVRRLEESLLTSTSRHPQPSARPETSTTYSIQHTTSHLTHHNTTQYNESTTLRKGAFTLLPQSQRQRHSLPLLSYSLTARPVLTVICMRR